MDPMALYQSIEASKRRDQEKLNSSMEGVNRAVMMMAQQAMRAELAGERGEAARLKAEAILDAKKLELEAQREDTVRKDERTAYEDERADQELYRQILKENPEAAKREQALFQKNPRVI